MVPPGTGSLPLLVCLAVLMKSSRGVSPFLDPSSNLWKKAESRLRKAMFTEAFDRADGKELTADRRRHLCYWDSLCGFGRRQMWRWMAALCRFWGPWAEQDTKMVELIHVSCFGRLRKIKTYALASQLPTHYDVILRGAEWVNDGLIATSHKRNHW